MFAYPLVEQSLTSIQYPDTANLWEEDPQYAAERAAMVAALEEPAPTGLSALTASFGGTTGLILAGGALFLLLKKKRR